MTYTLPRRRTILQFLHRFLTELLTFIFCLSIGQDTEPAFLLFA